MIKWLTIVISLLGLCVAGYAVATEGRTDQKPPAPLAPPSINPFASGIAAAGSIEAKSRNITIAAPDGGVVSDVYAAVGQTVNLGDPLFKLDTRLLEADLVRAQAARATAVARLARLKSQPRAEELPPFLAAIARSEARLSDAQDLYTDTKRAASNQAVAPMEIERRKFAVQIAEAELQQSRAQYDLLKAGAWSFDLAVAEGEVAQANAEIQSISLRMDRLTVRAPIAGTILKRNIEPGQYAGIQQGASAMVLGDLSVLRVRARVDEEDAPLLREKSAAVARIRGIAGETIPLKWLWVEPLAQPKNELTGATTERVDTRVVEVVFEVERAPKARIFPGQVVDVYIEAIRNQ